ncbi:hypothetical protein N7499_011121 [Penicillium canescens]|nr:hypothetical protein N7499_011121 [Penicillium canescens]
MTTAQFRLGRNGGGGPWAHTPPISSAETQTNVTLAAPNAPRAQQISDDQLGNLARLNHAASLAQELRPSQTPTLKLTRHAPMVGETRRFASDLRVRRAANRQSRSCKVCRLRKVKCDRVKPCHACCAHGYPSKCVYEDIPDEDARPISQAEEIRNLRAEIRELRGRIDARHDGSRSRNLQQLEQLEGLFDSIRSAPLDLVEELVRELRTAHGGLNKDLVPVGPWEGREAYESYEQPSRPSSTLPVRKRLLLNSANEDFNTFEDDNDDDREFEREMSIGSGSDSSGEPQ